MWTMQEFIDEIRSQEPTVDLSSVTVEEIGEAVEKMVEHTLIGEAVPNDEEDMVFDEGDLDMFMDNVEFYIEGVA